MTTFLERLPAVLPSRPRGFWVSTRWYFLVAWRIHSFDHPLRWYSSLPRCCCVAPTPSHAPYLSPCDSTYAPFTVPFRPLRPSFPAFDRSIRPFSLFVRPVLTDRFRPFVFPRSDWCWCWCWWRLIGGISSRTDKCDWRAGERERTSQSWYRGSRVREKPKPSRSFSGACICRGVPPTYLTDV